MNTLVHAEYAAHPGIARADRAVEVLAAAGKVVRHAFSVAVDATRQSWNRWLEARRQAEADAKLWDLALTDARVMADISRAMSADAIRDIKAYY